jgi:hypothetical protein
LPCASLTWPPHQAFRSLLLAYHIRAASADFHAAHLTSTLSPLSYKPGGAALFAWTHLKRAFLPTYSILRGPSHARGVGATRPQAAPLTADSHAAVKALQEAIQARVSDARLHITGPHRRDITAARPLSLLLIHPLASHSPEAALPGTASDAAWHARGAMQQMLLEERLLLTTPGAAKESSTPQETRQAAHGYVPLFLPDAARTPVDLQYVSLWPLLRPPLRPSSSSPSAHLKPRTRSATTCLSPGAAQLLLTGDARFARFLTDLAEEGFGMRLDAHGLWTRPGLGSSRAETRAVGGMGSSGVPTGMQMRSFLEDAQPEEAAERHASALSPAPDALRMAEPPSTREPQEEGAEASADAALEARRERNRAMGLPPDFDSGLGLDSPSDASSSQDPPSASGTTPPQAELMAKQDKPREDLYHPSWRRLCAEADEEMILDTLGLAYLPPEARVSRAQAGRDG